MGIKLDYKSLEKKLITAPMEYDEALKMFAQQGATKMQNYARTHRRWTDRTGHARQRLNGYIEVGISKIRVCIAHGVDYGIWLELCNNKCFAILEETVLTCSREIIKGLETLMGYIK